MERRFFIATILSVLILWVWSVLVPRPLLQSQYIDNTQVPEYDNVVTDNSRSLVAAVNPSLLPTPFSVEEKIEKIETDKLAVQFSSEGGVLKQIGLKEYGMVFPVRNIAGQSGYSALEFRPEKINDKELSYTYSDEVFFIRRIYKLSANDYTIEVETEIKNKTNMSRLVDFAGQGFVLDVSRLDKKDQEYLRDRSLFEYVISSASGIIRKSSAFRFVAGERKEISGEVDWVGFRNRYFCLIVKPQYKTKKYIVNPINDNVLAVDIPAEQANIDPGSQLVFSYFIFAGPEKLDILKQYKMNFEDIKRYYRLTLFDAIAKIIYSLLNNIHKFLPNWGVSIIILAIILYLITYPLTLRGMLSMRETQRKMQIIQPKMIAIQEKYKNNPQQKNIEVMELFKKNNINPIPLGGCLPTLLQMPIFFGLSQILLRSISFKNAHFLWIKDLLEPDRLIILPFSLWIFGNELNLLPIISAVVMAFQQKLTSKSMVITDPDQARQQKIMSFFVPIMIGSAFYKFSSGWTLYFTMFYILSTFTQWKMSKLPRPTQV